jgi:hypothetical protein
MKKLQMAAMTLPAEPLLIHLHNTLALPKVAATGIDDIVDPVAATFGRDDK